MFPFELSSKNKLFRQRRSSLIHPDPFLTYILTQSMQWLTAYLFLEMDLAIDVDEVFDVRRKDRIKKVMRSPLRTPV